MKISEILSFFNIDSNDQTEIDFISDSSFFKKEKWVYFNLSNYENANKYVKEALENNAYLVISEHNLNNVIYVENLREKINLFLIKFYKFKKNFQIIGITGTQGKSSLSYYLKETLKNLNFKVKNITLKKEEDSYVSELTTPKNFLLFEILKKCENLNIDFLIFEISSIGYCLNRVKDIEFDYLFLTSIDKDHLDFHKTKKKYIMVKKEIFSLPCKQRFVDLKIKEKYKIDIDCIQIDSKIIKKNHQYHLIFDEKEIKTPFIFKNQLKTISYIYAFLKYLNIEENSINQAINKLKIFKGRMNIVSYSPFIIIDYAHTAKSLEELLLQCKYLFNKKIILIIGSGGNRDVSKRKDYSFLANKYCQKVILTNDNPREEDEDKIIDDLKIYLQNYQIIKERRNAIKEGIKLLDEESLLLIVGKGDEDFMCFNGYKKYFNDFEEVEKCLKTLI